jgi:hypothetical protein
MLPMGWAVRLSATATRPHNMLRAGSRPGTIAGMTTPDAEAVAGVRRITLWVADASARARAFYRRSGFRSTGRRQLVRPEEPDHWEAELMLDLSRPTAP